MRIRKIFEDKNTLVKEVWYMDSFLYTVTNIIDDEGFCIKSIKVFKDGKVIEQ